MLGPRVSVTFHHRLAAIPRFLPFKKPFIFRIIKQGAFEKTTFLRVTYDLSHHFMERAFWL